ncbi:hypothetical protein CDL15_Pgr026440 [Punica granatum]|uniref:Myb/SANT-like domain-containing protein n=1 Tax=Punica granatum TaxID=22663 RepID=A0A218XJB5_PUNGR|nr:hypothetical protein CDL15_Pgr026440 [Punica granatum]
MAPKGEGIVEWTDELAFIDIMVDKFQRTHTSRWDGPTNTVKANPDIWDKFIKRHNNFRTFRSKGCKHYEALKLMYKYATTSGAYEFLQPTHLRAPDPMHA